MTSAKIAIVKRTDTDMMTRAKARSFEDWVEFYEQKTGDKYKCPNGYRVYYLPDRGFAQFNRSGNMLLIYTICGDGKFWRDFAEVIATSAGLDAMGSICTRAPLPYIRFWGWKIEHKEEKDGFIRFRCRDKRGRKVVLTPKHTEENGDVTYWVTQYLKKEDKKDG